MAVHDIIFRPVGWTSRQTGIVRVALQQVESTRRSTLGLGSPGANLPSEWLSTDGSL